MDAKNVHKAKLIPGQQKMSKLWHRIARAAGPWRCLSDALAPDLGRPHYTMATSGCGRIPTGLHALLPAADRRKGPDRPGLAALIFLTARPMPGPPDDGRRRAMANRPLVSNVRRRSLPHTLPARRQVRQHYPYIRVCAESCECLGLPTKREHGARSSNATTPGCCSDSRRTGAQGASGVERAGTPARAVRSSLCLPFHRHRQLGC